MKAEDLRLGNLILVNGEIQEVCELPLPENCNDENTEPIPLTEQWLLDLGFEKVVAKVNLGVTSQPPYWWIKGEFVLSKTVKGLVYGHRASGLNNIIQYVHQLQNLYFALTGEEPKLKTMIEIRNELKEDFKMQSGIDMNDHEYKGVFPYFNPKKQKWSSIPRGKAWQMYAEWLENKLYP